MKPLDGIRVLDFTWVLSGPFATRLLADYGAEVIKIQSLVTSKTPQANNDPYTCTWNRNKRSITLDMGKPEARELFFELVRISDVVIDNFSPHVFDDWGIDYGLLSDVNPGIVQAQISAAGHSGDMRDISLFGPGVQAMAGLTALTSYGDGEPMGIGFAYADHVMGLYASFEILKALYARRLTGKGAYIDISGIDATKCVLDTKAPAHAYTVKCEDGKWCAISPADERELAVAKGLEGKFDSEGLVHALQHEHIAASVVMDSHDLFSSAQLRARNCFETIEHPVIGKMLFDRTPIRTAPDEPGEAFASPQLGEANEYVFKELLHMGEPTYKRCVEDGIIA